MNATDISEVFKESFPDIGFYQKTLKPILGVLCAGPERVPLTLVCDVLHLDRSALEQMLHELDPIVVENAGQLAWRSPDIKAWLLAQGGDYALDGAAATRLADFLWAEYQRFAVSAYQLEVLDCLAPLLPMTAHWQVSEDHCAALNTLGLFLRHAGRWQHCVGIYLRVIEVVQSLWGSGHSEQVVAQNNLANVRKQLGQFEEALSLLHNSLAVCELPRHAQDTALTAQTLSSLAHLLREQGQYAQCKPYFERSLEIYQQSLGPVHAQTANAINDLAYLLKDMGEYDASEKLYRQALEIREQTLGVDHTDTAVTLNNLAILLELRGNYDEPEVLQRRALEIFEKQRGADHADTAAALCNLANLLRFKGQYAEAEQMCRRSLSIYEDKLKWDNHLHTAHALQGLAHLLNDLCRFEEAESYFKKSLRIRESILGHDHPHIAQNLNGLSVLLCDQGKFEEAKVML